MALLPVPVEVKNMHEKIDRLIDLVSAHDNQLQRVAIRMDGLRSDEKQLTSIRSELMELRNAVLFIKDHLRFNSVA